MMMNALEILTPLTTVLALALALGMGAALFRLLRDERRRSDARVAALIEAASAEAPRTQGRIGADAEAIITRTPGRQETHPPAKATTVGSAADLALQPTADVAGVSAMFAEPEHQSPWGRRIVVAACVATILSVAGYVLLSRDSTMDEAAAPAAAGEAQPAPLELLSLRHTQQSDRLTITGLVQNPRTGAALSRVTATAFLFSGDGTFLASGRAPLDFTTLGPGDESPFVVTVPVTGTVARYRVGFRGADGRVIAHVDRRASGTMASRH